MKNILFVASVVLLASCSAPKYTYHFDHYDYNSGKKKNTAVAMGSASQGETAPAALPTATEESILIVESEALTASAEPQIATAPTTAAPAAGKAKVEKKYSEMSKAEKKEFRKAVKAEIKQYIKATKNGDVPAVKDTKAMDYNLKMAIIFGAVALTLSFFGGVNSVFWIISVVTLVIGVVFFIKWIAEQ